MITEVAAFITALSMLSPGPGIGQDQPTPVYRRTEFFGTSYVDISNSLPWRFTVVRKIPVAQPESFSEAVKAWKASATLYTARCLACLVTNLNEAAEAQRLLTEAVRSPLSKTKTIGYYGLVVLHERIMLQTDESREKGAPRSVYFNRLWKYLNDRRKEMVALSRSSIEFLTIYLESSFSVGDRASQDWMRGFLAEGAPIQFGLVLASLRLSDRGGNVVTPGQAAIQIEKVLKKDPDNWRALYLLYKAHTMNGSESEAAAAKRRLFRLLPGKSVWRDVIARYERSGRANAFRARPEDFRPVTPK